MAYDAAKDFTRRIGSAEARDDVGRALEAVDISATDHDFGAGAAGYPRALWVGGAGVVQIVAVDDNDETPVPMTVAANTLLPIAFRKIVRASTTATLMVAIY